MRAKTKKILKWILENLGIILTALTLLLMFWQSWRDIFNVTMNNQERIKALEVQYGHEDRLRKLEEKKL